VPEAVEVDALEVRVVFPSGPLGGDLIARKPLPVKREKK
jgi:hypothetical protein